MRTDLNETMIQIPGRLNAAVEESLREVETVHRRRAGKRACTVCGSVMAFVGAFLVFGFSNPALASQIPLVGGLFRQVNAQSKMPGATHIEEYGGVQPVGKQAETAGGDCALTVTQAYSDGYTMQLGLSLEMPEELGGRYDAIDTEYGRKTMAKIGGEDAEVVIVNPFCQRDGVWESTMTLNVPEAQRGRKDLAVSLVFESFSGRRKAQGGSQDSEPLAGTFSVEIPVTVDQAHEFSFESGAQDNGAKVLAVSGTPAQTVISVERPYWGEVHPDVPEDGAKGYPVLYTMDGEKVGILGSKSYEEGGWDYESRETLNADLYFDGLPAGTEQAVLRFYDSHRQKEVLAEFTVDLARQTVVPSTSYNGGGPLDMENPTLYAILQEGHEGEEQNGYSVKSVRFSCLRERYTGSVSFSFPQEKEGGKLRAEVYDSQGSLLFSTDSMGEDGAWNETWSYQEASEYAEEVDGEKISILYPAQYSAQVPLEGERVPIGTAVTTKIIDLESGETVCTDTRTLNSVQY